MNFPETLKYTREHEWAKVDGDTLSVGITDHAQSALGDLVFLELPEIGRSLKTNETFGVAESIKAVSDLYSPVSGTVTDINNAAKENPSLLNQDPYDQGWLLKIKISDPSELNDLLSAKDYKDFVASL